MRHLARPGAGLFVTGTDTGVGKTRIACALLRGFARRGERVVGMKPVAAGATRSAGGLSNEDVERLRSASNVTAPGELVNPYCFEPAIAPHIAAVESGIAIDELRIIGAYLQLAQLAQRVIVEGAGGFAVPLGPNTDMASIARHLGLPVVLVVGMRLGCLNHALLTAAAIERMDLSLVGWVANCVDARMERLAANVDALRDRLPGAFLGMVPFDPGGNHCASSCLDLERLAEPTRTNS
jgi:dethiobiotin synthetase